MTNTESADKACLYLGMGERAKGNEDIVAEGRTRRRQDIIEAEAPAKG
jgi:hypothetical protein